MKSKLLLKEDLPIKPKTDLEKHLVDFINNDKILKNFSEYTNLVIRCLREAIRKKTSIEEIKEQFSDDSISQKLSEIHQRFTKAKEIYKSKKLSGSISVTINGNVLHINPKSDDFPSKFHSFYGVYEFLTTFENFVKNTTNKKNDSLYVLNDDDKKNIKFLVYQDDLMVVGTTTFKTTNKFIFHLWQNPNMNVDYANPKINSPYCTRVEGNWYQYSKNDPNYTQYWFLKIPTHYHFAEGDLTNSNTQDLFYSLIGLGKDILVCQGDSNNDWCDYYDQNFRVDCISDHYFIKTNKYIIDLNGYSFDKVNNFIKQYINSIDLCGTKIGFDKNVPFEEKVKNTNLYDHRSHIYLKIDYKNETYNPIHDVVACSSQDYIQIQNGHFVYFTQNGEQIDRFEQWNGDIDCYNYYTLTSLEGVPQEVGGYFDCFNCDNLPSLKGSPQEVGGYFSCSDCNKLTSLEGAPQKVGGGFDCSNCTNLTSLEGVPQEVGGGFYCYYCSNLTSLEGAPQEVGGDFSCFGCDNLTSLEGAPQKVSGRFNCFDCKNLTSLIGAPQEVGDYFDCSKCDKLTSLDGLNVSGIKGKIYVPDKLKSQLEELKQIQKIQECYNFYFD